MTQVSDQELNSLMDRASKALVDRRYLLGEALCLQALEMARTFPDWDYYARIVLPLQECRRHRRMIASEGEVRLGCSTLQNPAEMLAQHPTGCLLLTYPWSREQARQLARLARMQNQYFIVLWANSQVGDSLWMIQPFQGGNQTQISLPAPPADWRDRWIQPAEKPAAAKSMPSTMRPADWFIDASERQGDALLASLSAPLDSPSSLLELSQLVEAACDHEILHQRLAEAARALHHQSA